MKWRKKIKKNKKPEKKEYEKVNFWKGEVNKLRRLLKNYEKRLNELEKSIGKEKAKIIEEEKPETFREKFLRENYPGNKEDK